MICRTDAQLRHRQRLDKLHLRLQVLQNALTEEGRIGQPPSPDDALITLTGSLRRLSQAHQQSQSHTPQSQSLVDDVTSITSAESRLSHLGRLGLLVSTAHCSEPEDPLPPPPSLERRDSTATTVATTATTATAGKRGDSTTATQLPASSIASHSMGDRRGNTAQTGIEDSGTQSDVVTLARSRLAAKSAEISAPAVVIAPSLPVKEVLALSLASRGLADIDILLDASDTAPNGGVPATRSGLGQAAESEANEDALPPDPATPHTVAQSDEENGGGEYEELTEHIAYRENLSAAQLASPAGSPTESPVATVSPSLSQNLAAFSEQPESETWANKSGTAANDEIAQAMGLLGSNFSASDADEMDRGSHPAPDVGDEAWGMDAADSSSAWGEPDTLSPWHLSDGSDGLPEGLDDLLDPDLLGDVPILPDDLLDSDLLKPTTPFSEDRDASLIHSCHQIAAQAVAAFGGGSAKRVSAPGIHAADVWMHRALAPSPPNVDNLAKDSITIACDGLSDGYASC
jgi:hypothetical protein